METITDLNAASRVSVLRQSTGQTTVRSLSATARKKNASSHENPPTMQEMTDLLEAVHAENVMMDNVAREDKVKDEKGRRAEGGKMGALTPSVLSIASPGRSSPTGADIESGEGSSQASPSTTQDRACSSKGSLGQTRRTGNQGDLASSLYHTGVTVQRDQPSHKTSFPIKPVLLGYASTKPPKHPVKQVREPGPELEGGEEDIASQSLTEHTLKIITDKVRNMNSRYTINYVN